MHVAVWILVAVVVGVGVASVVPYPGHCDVQVTVQNSDTAILVGNVYTITGVSGQTAGQSRIIDWQAIGLGFAPPAISATLTEKVTLSNGQSVSKSANALFPSVPVLNGQPLTASDTFTLGYVPTGTYTIQAELDQSGVGQVATGSGTVTVGC
ncbi:MAG: hypothetical protein KGI98_12085 [Euryarchaeota archaeon]|nr:hypothetical protein [Euryarchaeota archaeon]MDE1881209.1 hypothetical protein [Euryarchaeota archaeon]